MKDIYEKAGLFYLGKDVDKTTQEPTNLLTLLKSKNFTTHAAIIGMTGSGKTGLGIGLIEEAAIDNIPAIIIDPKGDMGNLLLCDPSFDAKSFEPWIASEASSKNENVHDYAKKTALMWEDGIKKWGQDRDRVQKFYDVKKSIYTPGSLSGLPINIISSLGMPSLEILSDSDSYASYIKSTATSILSLVGIDSNGIDSKEYILIAQLLNNAWLNHQEVSLASLISQVIEPPFDSIGILPLESFYPKNDRFALATKFNSLLASPDFAMWLQGESLDIQKLLYDENGKAKVSIFAISHLNDNQRMFFVTLLLNQYLSWMRRQSGTTTLRALLYMDEIYGFFPPSKNPPSKEPMMLLLKQARAFGLGVVLSTQNPVDLDYKGLSNIGTWFIGRLQTSQDIQRVIDGLDSKVGSSYNKQEIKNLIANLKKRTFFLKSSHLDDIRLFSTRWVLSYLKGPLSKQEISTLMASQKSAISSLKTQQTIPTDNYETYQDIDSSILQYFEPNISHTQTYIPTICAKVNVHFENQRKAIDELIEVSYMLELSKDTRIISWEDSIELKDDFSLYPTTKPQKARYQTLPSLVQKDKALKHASKELKDYIYTTSRIILYKCKEVKLESKPFEDKNDFLVRVQDALSELKETQIEKLQSRYDKRFDILQDRHKRAMQRVQKEEQDSTDSMLEAGISILGALFGRTTSTKVGRAISKGSKVLKEKGDITRAKQRVNDIEVDIEELEYELEDKIEEINEKYDINNISLQEIKIKPKKSDIDINECAIVWRSSLVV